MQITSPGRRADVGVSEPFRLVDVAGTFLAVAEHGAGQPVLCLHAIAHGGRDFETFIALTAGRGLRVATLDWPGQGRSPPDRTGAPACATRYAEILEAALLVLYPNGETPILIGNSIGGAAAILAASRRPDRVKALVLSNPGGLAPVTPFVRDFCLALAAIFRAGVGGEPWFPAFYGLYYRGVLRERRAAEQRRRIVASGREVAPRLAEAWASFADPATDLRETLKALPIPILFAWARGDHIVSWSRSRAAVTASGAKVRFFPGGHSPFLEDPEAYADTVVGFARGLEQNEAR